jgi:hypothetical protein
MPSSRGPQKSRIVIDLDQAKQRSTSSPHPKGRWLPLVGISLLALLLIGTILIYRWWQNYRTSPTYSLAALIHAAKDNDTETFDKYFDSNQVTLSLGQQLTESIGINRLTSLANINIKANSNTTQLPTAITNTVREKASQQIKEYTADKTSKFFIITALTLPFALDSLKQDGDITSITLKRWGQPTNIRMKKFGSEWKVVAIENQEMINRVLNSVKEIALPTNDRKRKG